MEFVFRTARPREAPDMGLRPLARRVVTAVHRLPAEIRSSLECLERGRGRLDRVLRYRRPRLLECELAPRYVDHRIGGRARLPRRIAMPLLPLHAVDEVRLDVLLGDDRVICATSSAGRRSVSATRATSSGPLRRRAGSAPTCKPRRARDEPRADVARLATSTNQAPGARRPRSSRISSTPTADVPRPVRPPDGLRAAAQVTRVAALGAVGHELTHRVEGRLEPGLRPGLND